MKKQQIFEVSSLDDLKGVIEKAKQEGKRTNIVLKEDSGWDSVLKLFNPDKEAIAFLWEEVDGEFVHTGDKIILEFIDDIYDIKTGKTHSRYQFYINRE